MFGVPLKNNNFDLDCAYNVFGNLVCINHDNKIKECKQVLGAVCSPFAHNMCCNSTCLPIINKNKPDWNATVCQDPLVWHNSLHQS